MVYAYIRVSTDKQSIENQRYEILKFADQKNIKIDAWTEETISGVKSIKNRSLGELLNKLNKNDMLIVSELSRLGRNLMEVMSILHDCMEKDVKVFTLKEGYELGKNINSKILAFAFSLSAEIERNLISQRTKEALACKKAEGKTLGRPVGSQNKQVKLSGKEGIIKELLEKKISVSAIARITGVNRLTVDGFIRRRNLKYPKEEIQI
jgi:DNA invertase Pin-like site-specific DNA recombinase